MGLILGDCVEVMRSMPEDSVDSIVCDPPAGINFMNKAFDSDRGGRKQWVAWLTEVMAEVLRVAKPGAHAFVWALPRTSHWTAWALEDAGWEIREVVHHLFGSGFPKSKNLGNGFGTALKPAAENWILCRAPLSEKSVTANFEKHGVGALNIGLTRVGTSKNVPASGSGNRRSGYGMAADRDGTTGFDRSTGRWPANVILSHSPECQRVGLKRVPNPGGKPNAEESHTNTYGWATGGGIRKKGPLHADPDGFEEVEAFECVDSCPVAELDRQSGTLKSNGRNAQYVKGMGYQGGEGRKAEAVSTTQGGASRFFKTFEGEQDGMSEPSVCTHPDCTVELHLADRCLGTEGAQVAFEGEPRFKYQAKASRAERGEGNTHPCVKPLALMRYLVKLVTPPGGVVLDPFCGSGSTLVAAIQEGFEAVGIEREAEYIEIAERRVAHARAEIESQPLVLEV